eukprot:gene14158-18998_t
MRAASEYFSRRPAPGQVQRAPLRGPVGSGAVFADRPGRVAPGHQGIAPVFLRIGPARAALDSLFIEGDGPGDVAARHQHLTPLGKGERQRRPLTPCLGRPAVRRRPIPGQLRDPGPLAYAQVTVQRRRGDQGLGTTGGFKLQIEDRASLGYEAMDNAVKAFMAKAYQTPELAGLFTSWQVNVPQLYANIDRTKARQLGVPVTDIFDTLQIYLGSLYANDFNQFGRTYSVRVQADAAYRARAEDVGLLKVRSATGEMVPLSALMKMEPSFGPERAMRYNGYLAADVNGGPAPGYSSGQAQAAIERIAKETLPQGITFEWTELTYQDILSGNTMIYVFPLCVLL